MFKLCLRTILIIYPVSVLTLTYPTKPPRNINYSEISFYPTTNFVFSIWCQPINSNQFKKANLIRVKRSSDYPPEYGPFECIVEKEDFCIEFCSTVPESDGAECEDPWPPTDCLSCYCYKQNELVSGRVLHLNLTEDLYLDPEKLAIALT